MTIEELIIAIDKEIRSSEMGIHDEACMDRLIAMVRIFIESNAREPIIQGGDKQKHLQL